SDEPTVLVGLPAGRSYESPEMLVVVSPTTRRMLIELALGRGYYILDHRTARCIFPPPPSTTIDRASDLLALTSALGYLRAVKAPVAPEAQRLADQIRGLVAELVALQNDDGGWPWVPVTPRPDQPPNQAGPPRPLSSARVAWALSAADSLGFLPDQGTLPRSDAFLPPALPSPP